MSNNINSLPPPFPNQALAQTKTAHQIPLNDGVRKVQVDPVSKASAGNSGSANKANVQTDNIDIKV